MRSLSTAWPWWPGAAVAGLALTVPASIDITRLSSGGLAPVAVAAVLAGVVSVPAARIRWQQRQPSTTRTSRSLQALAPILAVFWVSAVASNQLQAGVATAVELVLGALSVYLSVRRWPHIAPVVWTAMALLAATVLGASSLGGPPPWTLLEPHWETWSQWMPWSMTAGALLGLGGLGVWRSGPSMPPGGARLAWLPTSLGVWVALALAVRLGAQYETHLEPTSDPWRTGVVFLCLAAGAAVALPQRASPRFPIPLEVLAVAWFAGPGNGSQDWFLYGWLPAGIALVSADNAHQSRGLQRGIFAALTTVACGAALWGWPDVPANPADAVRAALTGLVLLWVAGTRGLSEEGVP